MSQLNQAIVSAAQQHGALLYDLNDLFARARSGPLTAGGRTLSGIYLGGFYSLSGFYPGARGQALIANEILALINQSYRTTFPSVDLAAVAANDPAVRFQPAGLETEGQQ